MGQRRRVNKYQIALHGSSPGGGSGGPGRRQKQLLDKSCQEAHTGAKQSLADFRGPISLPSRFPSLEGPAECLWSKLCFADIHDSDGSSSSSHQNPKSTDKWAASLENLLEDPEGVKRFREFLKKEFSEENVLFWLACEDFKKTQDKKQIFNLMKYDSYSRFLKSDLFLKHKRTEEEDEDPPDAQTAAKRASRIYNT
ncbi:PREDICTED: regulator of G-protein signaling 10 [Lipotes vexillifer]|uniref:Regulator of G-protein signaling 10 n=1 Tax=Lipotes vexillifer TaxID=118797 RepID=A0A340Y7R3_LIPVE|nr:PREDICTED: regulator of G-protein signaling 10 [Lipotes vexillifer]